MKSNRFLIVFIFIFLSLLIFKFFNPGERDGKIFLQHLNEQEIEYIELRPVGGNAPVRAAVKIIDKDQIDLFLSIWKGIDTFIANHPNDRWSMRVSFHSSAGVYAGVLASTSNQGMIFELDQGPTKWPVLSDYQLMKSSSDVEEVLHKIRFPD